MINDMTKEQVWYVCRRRQEMVHKRTKVLKEMILETGSRSYANLWANYLDEADVACKYYISRKPLKQWADIDEIDRLGMPTGA